MAIITSSTSGNFGTGALFIDGYCFMINSGYCRNLFDRISGQIQFSNGLFFSLSESIPGPLPTDKKMSSCMAIRAKTNAVTNFVLQMWCFVLFFDMVHYAYSRAKQITVRTSKVVYTLHSLFPGFWRRNFLTRCVKILFLSYSTSFRILNSVCFKPKSRGFVRNSFKFSSKMISTINSAFTDVKLFQKLKLFFAPIFDLHSGDRYIINNTLYTTVWQ